VDKADVGVPHIAQASEYTADKADVVVPHIAQASEYTVDKADVVVEDAAAANMVAEVAGDEVTSAPRLLTIYVTCNKRG
jgi:hypothetical protein